MKKKALILFKAPWHWNKFIINKLSKFYNIEYIYLNKIKKNYIDTINEINFFIDKKKIDIIFFDVDYQKFIHLFFIRKIRNIKKIMFTNDDYERHNLNLITAAGCDVVLCVCPIAPLKYNEIGYSSYFWPLESDKNIYKNTNKTKIIDVLFFGKINDDRKNFVEHLKNNGIKVEVVGNDGHISHDELINFICKSKIVLNFSKSTWGSVKTIPEEGIFEFYYQFKGRIIEVGLCGTACVSEYAPQNDLLFNKDELYQFKNKDECLKILKDLLNDNEKLYQYTDKFEKKVKNFYEDEPSFQNIFHQINKKSKKKENLIRIPYWYLRIAAKQILLRDINILNISASSRHLSEILKITKKSKIYMQILILLESFINLFWYSIKRMFLIKSKGKDRYKNKL